MAQLKSGMPPLTSPSQLVNYFFFFFFLRQLPDSSTERLNTQELLVHMFSTHTIKEAGLYRMKLQKSQKGGTKCSGPCPKEPPSPLHGLDV